VNPRDRALELLERHIGNGRQDGADPAVTARECLLAMEGLGYRPTEARPAPDWKLRSTGGGPSEETRAELEAAKQRAAEATARFRGGEQDGDGSAA
jgi:hypothetical protein